MKNIAIIGGGPAALMLAAQLDTDKYTVTLCEKNKAVGRKFLVAGVGGLNLTYEAPVEQLTKAYHPSAFIASLLEQFSNEDLVSWFNYHEIPTFVGSSNRVFPDLKMKPIEVLTKIVELVESNDVDIQLETKWEGWNFEDDLKFEDYEDLAFDIVIFAMGGASWKVTGSDGVWRKAFEERGISVKPFRSANCAFAVEWGRNLFVTHQGKALKNVAMTIGDKTVKGELVITEFGLEGNAIYALTQEIQDQLEDKKEALVYLDLKPNMTAEEILAKYKKSELTKTTDILKEDLNLTRAAIAVLKQFSAKETFLDPSQLCATLKAIPIPLGSADELDKAISSLGGVALDEIDAHFQLKKIPNTYVIGEMLDWYASTGGYLLQGCFSMGFVLAEHLNSMEVATDKGEEEE